MTDIRNLFQRTTQDLSGADRRARFILAVIGAGFLAHLAGLALLARMGG